MKRLYAYSLLTTLFLMQLPALEWPTDTQTFAHFFAQCTGQHTFEQGLMFENAQMVRAADNGLLLIELDDKCGACTFPSTLGNALIFLHDDDLQTVYGNLNDTDLFKNRTTAEAHVIIGKTGCSGWAQQHELIFQVRDNQKNVYINPLILLPHVHDTIPPKISDVVLINEQKEVFVMNRPKKIRQGSYELYARISDTVTKEGNRLSPFRVIIFVNGTNIRTIPFETITQKNGTTFLGNTAFTDTLLYQRKEELYLGNIALSKGKSDILITARDITGNETSEQFTVQVD